ncbi:MAG: oligosaccharide flippase family protein [Burkholderiaceae bacterium]
MTALTHLAHGAAWSVGGKLVRIATTMVALVLVARLVGPHAYGVFALSWVVVGLLESIVTTAAVDTLVQRQALRAGHCNATFATSLALGASGWLGITVGAGVIAGWLDGGALLEWILPARAATLPISALAVVPQALLTRESRFGRLAGVESGASLAASFAGIGLALLGAGIWSLVAMELIRTIMVAGLAIAASGWRPRSRCRVTTFASSAASSSPPGPR